MMVTVLVCADGYLRRGETVSPNHKRACRCFENIPKELLVKRGR
jgi:hypothetical protein